MRTLFFQFFVAFWLSTIGIFVVATAFDPDGQHGSLENILAFAQRDAAQVNGGVLAIYRHHGCGYVQRVDPDYLLLDGNGKPLCGPPVPQKTLATVLASIRNNRVEGVHDGENWVTATPIHDAEQTFAVLHRERYVPRPWLPHLPAVALPVSLVVTLLFAFLLTIPVRELSRAFRAFSSGNLSIRLPVKGSSARGWGGSDARSLKLDFNTMAERVSELINAQKTLVRDVSHELRSPLARLRLALEMAREEGGAPSAALDRMELEAERVNELIGQMLTLSLMESTQALTHEEPVDMRELIESMLPDLSFEAANRPCSVALNVLEEPYVIHGSLELLRRMLENVVRNAIRHTATGTQIDIILRASGSGASPGGGMLMLTVADRGPGVPEESLAKLFRAFYRTDASRTKATGGFGIGLSIAERAARLHRGSITARNRRSGGLSVVIQLPLNGREQIVRARRS